LTEFFRHCPGCGRRFHIKLVEKEDLGGYDAESRGPLVGVPTSSRGRMAIALVREGPLLVFDKEFAYRYKCQHCGHEWTENRTEEKQVKVDMDPIND